MAHCVEEEGARAAGGVEDALGERIIDRLGHHAGRQPVRRVVLAQAVTPVGRDDALVEHLHDVVLDVLPGKARQAARQPGHEGRALGHLDHPVEEVLLDDAGDAGLGELLAAQHRRCRKRRRIDAHDGVGDHLGRNDQQGVVDEEAVVVFEVGAEGHPQQARPELALELHRGRSRFLA